MDRRWFDLLILLVSARIKGWLRDRWLGFWWWLLEPLAMTVTYLLMVKVAFRADTPHAALFLMCAVLPWTWLMSAAGYSLRSIVGNANLLKSFSISCAIFPTVEVVATTCRFLLSLTVLGVLMAYYEIEPTWHLLWLPLIILVQFVFVWGISFWLAIMQIYVEDTMHAWQILSRIWFLLSPSIYAVDQLPRQYQQMAMLNPLAPIFCSYRAILINGTSPSLPELAFALCIGVAMLATGMLAINRLRGTVALVT